MNHIIDVSGSMVGSLLSQACRLVDIRRKPDDRIFAISMKMEEINSEYLMGCLYNRVISQKFVGLGLNMSGVDLFIQALKITGPMTFYSDDDGPIQSRTYRKKFGNYISLPVCPVCYTSIRPGEFERHFESMIGDSPHDVHYIMSA
jgi:hypothetical protein